MSKLLRNQVGDTIVEVLICIAIMAGVLASAYAIVSRTSNNSQQAREHSQALKVAESQVELLKALLVTQPGQAFCMTRDPASPTKTLNGFVALNAPTVPTAMSAYPTECRVPYGAETERFWVSITKDRLTPGPGTYKVHVKWDGATGGIDSVELAYKVF